MLSKFKSNIFSKIGNHSFFHTAYITAQAFNIALSLLSSRFKSIIFSNIGNQSFIPKVNILSQAFCIAILLFWNHFNSTNLSNISNHSKAHIFPKARLIFSIAQILS